MLEKRIRNHSRLYRPFLIAASIQALLLLAALGLSLIAKSQTSRARDFDAAASRLNADFENVSSALNRLYRELSDPVPSRLYINSLQSMMADKIVPLRQSLEELSATDLDRGRLLGASDDTPRQLLAEITPRINTFIDRTDTFVQSDFETLKERFHSPSVVDLVAARNGVVLRSLNRLVESSRARKQQTMELVHTGIKATILLLFLSLLASWYWIVRPAIAKQKEAIEREIDFSASLGKKNTELKLAESRAMVLYEEAVRGLRARTEFLAVVSHELRTPLNAIMGFSEVMKDEILGKHEVTAYRGYSNDIYRSGEHLLGIITDILQFTQLEADRCTLQSDIVAPADIFADARMITGDTAARKNIDLIFRNDLPEGSGFRADRRLLSQALINLIDNAIKFSSPDSTVVIGGAAIAQGGAVITVVDNGIGINPDIAPTLFQPFEQIESAFSRSSGGLGLGLSITQKIMTAHDGDVTVKTSKGGGSCFSLHLPDERFVAHAGSPGGDTANTRKAIGAA